jgi:hypothetical protein
VYKLSDAKRQATILDSVAREEIAYRASKPANSHVWLPQAAYETNSIMLPIHFDQELPMRESWKPTDSLTVQEFADIFGFTTQGSHRGH